MENYKPMEAEQWVAIPGYEGLYDVSNMGRIRSYQNFGYKLKDEPKIMNLSLNSYGYRQVTLCKNGCRKQTAVHLLVALAFLPPNPGGMQIDHVNGVKIDNRVDNLEWVTPKENTVRSVSTGLKPTGERHGNHKLTQQKVDAIRDLYKTGTYTHRQLGDIFGVSHGVVGRIVNNKAWREKHDAE